MSQNALKTGLRPDPGKKMEVEPLLRTPLRYWERLSPYLPLQELLSAQSGKMAFRSPGEPLLLYKNYNSSFGN